MEIKDLLIFFLTFPRRYPNILREPMRLCLINFMKMLHIFLLKSLTPVEFIPEASVKPEFMFIRLSFTTLYLINWKFLAKIFLIYQINALFPNHSLLFACKLIMLTNMWVKNFNSKHTNVCICISMDQKLHYSS